MEEPDAFHEQQVKAHLSRNTVVTVLPTQVASHWTPGITAMVTSAHLLDCFFGATAGPGEGGSPPGIAILP